MDYCTLDEKNGNAIYKPKHDKFMSDHEKELFNNTKNKKLNFVIEYTNKSENDVLIYSFPYPKYKTIFSLNKKPEYSIWGNLQNSNGKYYCKKWIYQIIKGVYEIHEKRETFIGTLSDECITIDDKLNAKIGFISENKTTSSSKVYNFLYFCEPKRIKERDFNNFNQDKSVYQKYDIFALGILIREILTFQKEEKFNEKKSIKDIYDQLGNEERYIVNNNSDNNNNDNNDNDNNDNDNNDNDNNDNNDNDNNDNDDNDNDNNDDDNNSIDDDIFTQRITNEIINLCLAPFDVRPSIGKINLNIETIYDDLKLRKDFATSFDYLKYNDNFKNIFEDLKQSPDLIMNFFINPDKPKCNYFKLNSFRFEVFYDGSSFKSVPVMINQEELEKKYLDPFFSEFFHSNLYFCNIIDLLKLYVPTDDEIYYWFLYLSQYIYDMHEKGEYLPPNFTLENILVSFFNYQQEIQMQLNIFPYQNLQSVYLTEYYVPDSDLNPECRDIFYFGLLMLEIIFKKYTNNFLFSLDKDKDKKSHLIKQMEELESYLRNGETIPEEQDTLIKFIEKCIFDCKGQEYANIHKELVDIVSKKKKSMDLYNYCRNYKVMDNDRFASLFDCFKSFNNKNLLIIFNNTMRLLCDNFIPDSMFFNPSLISYYLKKCSLQNVERVENLEEEEEEEFQEDFNQVETPVYHNFSLSSYSQYVKNQIENERKIKYSNEDIENQADEQDFTGLDARSIIMMLDVFKISMASSNGQIIDAIIRNDDDGLTCDELVEIAEKRGIIAEKINDEKVRLYILPDNQ